MGGAEGGGVYYWDLIEKIDEMESRMAEAEDITEELSVMTRSNEGSSLYLGSFILAVITLFISLNTS